MEIEFSVNEQDIILAAMENYKYARTSVVAYIEQGGKKSIGTGFSIDDYRCAKKRSIAVNNLLLKLQNIIMEIKPCPFCKDVPEPESFCHNSIKEDSWYIICDCGKAQVKDHTTRLQAIFEWNDQYMLKGN